MLNYSTALVYFGTPNGMPQLPQFSLAVYLSRCVRCSLVAKPFSCSCTRQLLLNCQTKPKRVTQHVGAAH